MQTLLFADPDGGSRPSGAGILSGDRAVPGTGINGDPVDPASLEWEVVPFVVADLGSLFDELAWLLQQDRLFED